MSATPQLPPMLSVNLGSTYGAYLIGAIVSALLYGILISQVMFYFNQYPKDPSTFKTLVVLLLVLDTASVIFEVHGLYHYLIVSFGDLENLGVQVWSIQVEALLSYTIMLIVQGFFTIRIWELSGRKWLFAGILTFLALAAYAFALAIVVKAFTFRLWSSSLLPYMKDLVATNKTLETVVDALITAGLCWYLHRGRSSIKRTNTMITKLMVFALNRGAITTVLQLGYLLAFEIKPDSLAWAAFHVTVTKIYTNSVLATLNSRNAIRGVGEDEEMLSVMTTGRNPSNYDSRQKDLSVFVAASSITDADEYTRKTTVNSETTVPVEISLQKSSRDHQSSWTHAA